VIAEPDVALTDYALALECTAFAWLLGDGSPLAAWFAVLFGAVAVGALAGGTVHGFCPDEGTWAARALWRLALLALGVAALAACGAGACLLASSGIVRAATIGLAVYAVLVAGGVETFAVALASHLAASAFLLATLLLVFRQTRDAAALRAALGLALTIVGAGLQRRRVTCPALRLTHNGLFHVVQGVALALVFQGARELTRRLGC
jgi:hypothetical protein